MILYLIVCYFAELWQNLPYMYRFKEKYTIPACILITALTFTLSWLYPETGILFSGYIIALILTAFIKRPNFTLILAVAIAGLLTFQYDIVLPTAVSNQLKAGYIFSIAIIAAITIFVMVIKRKEDDQESDRQQITALFEFATEGIILSNHKGEIILINPAALHLFQYKKEEVIGQPVEMLIPQRFTKNHITYRERFNYSPSNRTMGHGRDLYAKKKSGEEFPVEVSLSYYKNNNQLFVIAFLVDITQRKEAELKLIEQKEELENISNMIRKMNTELETKVEERTLILKEALQELEKSQKSLSEALNKEKELSEIKSRFVSMASHEFRTPLSTVLSSASLIGKYQTTEEQHNRDRHINKIKLSVKHLNELLEDFLSLGKLEEGKVTSQHEVFSLKDLVTEIIDELTPLLKPGQHIQFNWEGETNFTSDKKLLRNILINLISNASKFSDEEKPILINAIHQNDRLVLSVRDQGIGIAKEDIPHIFSSFFRGKNAVNIQGTGLGLHIVKRYLDLIKGTISFDSTLGEGTTIEIIVPNASASA